MSVPQRIKDLANKVRNEIYGKDVRESIAQSMEVTGETAEEAKVRSVEQTDRVDTLITENPQPSEVVDARLGYSTLRDKLNSTDQQLAQNKNFVSQGSNMVDKIDSLIKVRGMYLRHYDNSIIVGIGMQEELNSVVEYVFSYNTDGLLLLRGVKSGYEKLNANTIDIVLDGDFNTNSPPSVYTTTTDDSFNFEFEGSTLFFKTTVRHDGGIWEFILDDGRRRYISCYDDISEIGKEFLVFEGLPHKKYKGKAIFRGADPLNPVTQARGYVYHDVNDSSKKALRYGKIRPIDETTFQWIVSPNSIIDFAIAAKPSSASYASEWVPSHSGVSGASVGASGKVIIDGKYEFEFNNTSNTLPSYQFKEITDFEIAQRFYAKNPNGNDGNMWFHTANHSIRERKPYLTITNNIKLEQSVKFGSAYLGMLASPQSSMNKLELNNGVVYSPIPTDNSRVSLGNDISSAIFVGEIEPGRYHACALDVSSLSKAISYNTPYSLEKPVFLSFRPDDVSKVYFKFAEETTFNEGQTFSLTQRIACISGARHPTVL